MHHVSELVLWNLPKKYTSVGEATNYITLEEAKLQQSYPREKSSLVN